MNNFAIESTNVFLHNSLFTLQNYFGINSSTGEIFVQNNLDRETAVRVNLEVIVHDKMAEVGKQIATGRFVVIIVLYIHVYVVCCHRGGNKPP